MLQQLQQLSMDCYDCSPQAWAVIAALPRLQAVCFNSLTIDNDSAPAPSVLDLGMGVRMTLFLEVPQERLAGCLARLLPNMHRMDRIDVIDLLQLMTALQGHQQLRQAHISLLCNEEPPAAVWPGQLLSSMPALQDLELDMCGLFYNMDGVLAELAGCSKLTRLCVYSGSCDEPTHCSLGAGLAALAAGACVHSLQTLEVRLCSSSLGFMHGDAAVHAAWPAAAAELLKGGLVALRELSLQLPIDLPLPPGGGAEQRVGELLRQAGATVAFTVTEVKSTPYSTWCKLELGEV
jgi:hypothetical protein